MAEKRGFGEIERLPSGRIRARYTGPDLRRHSAPITFETRLDAEAWLVDERRLIASGEWLPTDRRGVPQVTSDLTFGEYAETWLAERAIKPTTYERYRLILKYDLLPPYGPIPMRAISPESIRTWHAKYGSTKPTARSQAYSLLRTILGTAVTDGLLGANPCHIRGAGNVKRVHKVEPATLAELEVMTNALPPRYRLMLLLAAWCAMRFGELAELRRKDLDLVNDVVRIRRAVVNGARRVHHRDTQDRRRHSRRRHPAPPDASRPGSPRRAHGVWQGIAALPRQAGRAHGHREPLQGLVPGP